MYLASVLFVYHLCGECLVRVSCLSVMFVQFCAMYVASVLFVCHVRTVLGFTVFVRTVLCN